MKTIILCGGYGTRLKEETEFKPKPMVKVGDKPILWHIMKIYSQHGFNEFVLALGYKGEMIRKYFSAAENHNECGCFKVTFAETGLSSLTGERLLRAKKYIDGDEFMVTYGDGVSDIDLNKLVDFHRKQGTLGTITGVHPYSKYGLIKIDQGKKIVTGFDQKPLLHDYVSGGFMIFKKEAFDYFDKGQMEDGLKRLVKDGQLSIFEHEGFWKAMDTYREKEELDKLWQGERPWVIWKNKST